MTLRDRFEWRVSVLLVSGAVRVISLSSRFRLLVASS
jgi:hypothetical protein